MLESKHAIGNHTFNHLNGWTTKTADYLHNVELYEELVKKVDAQKKTTMLFRPPYGRITRSQIRSLNRYNIVMWDVLSHDYSKNVSAEVCLRKTIKATRPGSILVFHDSFKAEKNLVYALPRLIDHFAEKGYVFKAIDP